jgi:copper resistance protein C
MKIYKQVFLLIISMGFVLNSSLVIAHTAVTITVPKNGAVLSESPKEIILRFSDEAYLNSISLIDEQGEVVPLTSSLPEALARRLSISLPSLKDGSYIALWSAEGTDTHVIQGELSFSVESLPQQ